MPRAPQHEAEWRTRKRRIDPALDAAGWRRAHGRPVAVGAWRTEEEQTTSGPADYALWLDGEVVAIVEAKKVGTATQGILSQAERYARGLPSRRVLGLARGPAPAHGAHAVARPVRQAGVQLAPAAADGARAQAGDFGEALRATVAEEGSEDFAERWETYLADDERARSR